MSGIIVVFFSPLFSATYRIERMPAKLGSSSLLPCCSTARSYLSVYSRRRNNPISSSLEKNEPLLENIKTPKSQCFSWWIILEDLFLSPYSIFWVFLFFLLFGFCFVFFWCLSLDQMSVWRRGKNPPAKRLAVVCLFAQIDKTKTRHGFQIFSFQQRHKEDTTRV